MKEWTLFLMGLFLLCLPISSCKTGDNGTSNTGPLPTISSVTPAAVNPGQRDIEGRVFGNNFTGIMSVNLGEGVIVQQYSLISSTELYIYFSVASDTPPGPRTVVVATSVGASSSSSVFSIGDNRFPEAKFVVSPSNNGLKERPFRFDASRSDDDGNIVSYKWKFGDGRIGSGRVINHKYNRGGIFLVTLTVTDDRNATSSSSRLLDVAASRPPIALFSVNPTSGNLATTFQFNAAGSRDPDGRISRYVWYFGDGETGFGETAQHRFKKSGTLPVTLTVFDNTGNSGFTTRFARVDGSGPAPPPPGGGSTCTNPISGRSPDLYGTVLSADRASKTIVIQLYTNATCANAFYRCGDVKKFIPGGENWYGAICGMNYLGNNTFSVQIGGGKAWPEAGEQDVYLHWQSCGGPGVCN